MTLDKWCDNLANALKSIPCEEREQIVESYRIRYKIEKKRNKSDEEIFASFGTIEDIAETLLSTEEIKVDTTEETSPQAQKEKINFSNLFKKCYENYSPSSYNDDNQDTKTTTLRAIYYAFLNVAIVGLTALVYLAIIVLYAISIALIGGGFICIGITLASISFLGFDVSCLMILGLGLFFLGLGILTISVLKFPKNYLFDGLHIFYDNIVFGKYKKIGVEEKSND